MELQNPKAPPKTAIKSTKKHTHTHTINKKTTTQMQKPLAFQVFRRFFVQEIHLGRCVSRISLARNFCFPWRRFHRVSNGPLWYTQWPSCQSHLVPRDAWSNLGVPESRQRGISRSGRLNVWTWKSTLYQPLEGWFFHIRFFLGWWIGLYIGYFLFIHVHLGSFSG